MLPNIVLVGFMGSGKSSVGRRLASLTGHRFLDTDDLVSSAAGRSIPEIFAAGGEAEFRDRESAALGELEGIAGVVLATGGGIVTREENVAAMRAIGVVAWLDADPDALFERVSRNAKRPLLQTDDPRGTFDALLSARRSLYLGASDFRIDSTGLGHDEVARLILADARRAQARRAAG